MFLTYIQRVINQNNNRLQSVEMALNKGNSASIKVHTQQSIGRNSSAQYISSDFSHLSQKNQSQQLIRQQFMGSFKKLPVFGQFENPNHEQDIIERLMELEGECKIREWEYIKFNLVQSIFVMIVLILTVFGLFALKYSPRFRRKVFFDSSISAQATHIFITGNDKKNDIVKILKSQPNKIYFQYKKLRYSITPFNKFRPTPVAYQFQRQFQSCFNLQRLKTGLNQKQVVNRRELIGKNEHLVEMPSYPQYLLDVLTEPFFLLQYFFCFIFFLQGYAPFSIALLFFSFLTTTINYILLFISYRKIKKIAQKITEITVIRQSKQVKIPSNQLVAGDVYIPIEQQQIPADCIVACGDVYVNEANLTGQSFPIGKFKIQGLEDVSKSNVWVYEGSKVVETKKGGTYCVVANTGFATHRGRIIRKILNRTVKDPDMLRTLLVFVFQVLIFSMITFFATLFLLLERDIQKLFVFFKFIDFLASSAPPPLPIFFNLAYSLSLFRLGFKGIIGTQPQKTVDGAQIKTFCFDKTGTLTKNDVSIVKIFRIKDEQKTNFHNVITQLGEAQNKLIWKLFATCHTTKLINDELLGDEIDKQMFKFINAKMQNSTDSNIRFTVKSTKQFPNNSQKEQIELGKEQQDILELQRKRQSLIKMKLQHKLEVLKINQFESRFQSMSVLIRDAIENRYYIFAKGAPQKIQANSLNLKSLSQNEQIYIKMVKTLSLNGFRTIAIGYKQLKLEQVQYYLKADRELYIQNIINLGLVVFENSLKHDTWLTINRLTQSNIQTKMITGDNIYIAVQTARRAGIIGANQKVVILQGQRNRQKLTDFNDPSGFSRVFQGIIINKVNNDISTSQSQTFTQQLIQIHQKSDYLKGNYTFAIDNSFLTLSPTPLLSHRIKIFARIPPQNKAYIIRQYKKQHNEYIRTHYSHFVRWLKINTWKIGMCGDGANDLLALREADLSIGVQATDAAYGSSFTVSEIIGVEGVIQESKCTQANVIQLYQYYGGISMFVLISSVILITDVTYFSTTQLMYLNFGTVLLIPGTIAMSRKWGEETQYVPDANMMGLHNHLIFWGNLIIPFLGVLGSWFYYSNTAQYQPNPKPSASVAGGGFNSKNYSTTLIFILVILTAAFNGLIMYRSKPWRERFFRNYLFTLLITLNLAVAFSLAFLTKQLESAFQFMPISKNNMGVCIGILLGSLLVSFFYNLIIQRFKLDHKKIVLQQEEAKLASLIQRKGKIKVAPSLIT